MALEQFSEQYARAREGLVCRINPVARPGQYARAREGLPRTPKWGYDNWQHKTTGIEKQPNLSPEKIFVNQFELNSDGTALMPRHTKNLIRKNLWGHLKGHKLV